MTPYNADPAQRAITGILHDFDWEVHPQLPDRPGKGSLILPSAVSVMRSAPRFLSHVPGRKPAHAAVAGLPGDLRRSPIGKALFACGELAGVPDGRQLPTPGAQEVHPN